MTAKAAKAKKNGAILHGPSLLTEHDIYLFKEGNHFNLYDKLGAHPLEQGGAEGTLFAVWAPGAGSVSVMGEFNGWNKDSHPLSKSGDHGAIRAESVGLFIREQS